MPSNTDSPKPSLAELLGLEDVHTSHMASEKSASQETQQSISSSTLHSTPKNNEVPSMVSTLSSPQTPSAMAGHPSRLLAALSLTSPAQSPSNATPSSSVSALQRVSAAIAAATEAMEKRGIKLPPLPPLPPLTTISPSAHITSSSPTNAIATTSTHPTPTSTATTTTTTPMVNPANSKVVPIHIASADTPLVEDVAWELEVC